MCVWHLHLPGGSWGCASAVLSRSNARASKRVASGALLSKAERWSALQFGMGAVVVNTKASTLAAVSLGHCSLIVCSPCGGGLEMEWVFAHPG